jgi:hypothetical protein
VKLYRFALRRNDGSNTLERAIRLGDVASAWCTVSEIAHDDEATDGRIFVKDEDGKVVIMIGVASARALLAATPLQWSQDRALPIAV